MKISLKQLTNMSYALSLKVLLNTKNEDNKMKMQAIYTKKKIVEVEINLYIYIPMEVLRPPTSERARATIT
jgi:hypothetical protein